MEDAEYKRWADEHLVYEAGMLRYDAERLARISMLTAGTAVAQGPGAFDENERNALLESFTIHARCLIDFLWGEAREDDDAVAAHFCPEGVWEKKRGGRPEEVAKVNRRVAKEIVHLTYSRRFAGEAKNWNYGTVFYELAGVLERFAQEAIQERLSDDTRKMLRGLLQGFQLGFPEP